MSTAVVLLADGFEEIEAVTIIDILRRGAIRVTMASVSTDYRVCGSHGICIQADSLLAHEMENNFDVVVLPGGQPGTNNLKANPDVRRFITQKQNLIAAICAAPTILAAFGLLDSHKVTSYPTEKKVFNAQNYQEKETVYDPPFLTSRGVGTAIPFSLEIIRLLCGKEKAVEVGNKILYNT